MIKQIHRNPFTFVLLAFYLFIIDFYIKVFYSLTFIIAGEYWLKGKVDNPEALEAYMDLILTAEYALPIGNRNYKNPLEKSNWAKVQLGGIYYLGEDNLPVNILITLRGESKGYCVENCKIVSVDEYLRYEDKLLEWQQAVSKMYDVYER